MKTKYDDLKLILFILVICVTFSMSIAILNVKLNNKLKDIEKEKYEYSMNDDFSEKEENDEESNIVKTIKEYVNIIRKGYLKSIDKPIFTMTI